MISSILRDINDCEIGDVDWYVEIHRASRSVDIFIQESLLKRIFRISIKVLNSPMEALEHHLVVKNSDLFATNLYDFLFEYTGLIPTESEFSHFITTILIVVTQFLTKEKKKEKKKR